MNEKNINYDSLEYEYIKCAMTYDKQILIWLKWILKKLVKQKFRLVYSFCLFLGVIVLITEPLTWKELWQFISNFNVVWISHNWNNIIIFFIIVYIVLVEINYYLRYFSFSKREKIVNILTSSIMEKEKLKSLIYNNKPIVIYGPKGIGKTTKLEGYRGIFNNKVVIEITNELILSSEILDSLLIDCYKPKTIIDIFLEKYKLHKHKSNRDFIHLANKIIIFEDIELCSNENRQVLNSYLKQIYDYFNKNNILDRMPHIMFITAKEGLVFEYSDFGLSTTSIINFIITNEFIKDFANRKFNTKKFDFIVNSLVENNIINNFNVDDLRVWNAIIPKLDNYTVSKMISTHFINNMNDIHYSSDLLEYFCDYKKNELTINNINFNWNENEIIKFENFDASVISLIIQNMLYSTTNFQLVEDQITNFLKIDDVEVEYSNIKVELIWIIKIIIRQVSLSEYINENFDEIVDFEHRKKIIKILNNLLNVNTWNSDLFSDNKMENLFDLSKILFYLITVDNKYIKSLKLNVWNKNINEISNNINENFNFIFKYKFGDQDIFSADYKQELINIIYSENYESIYEKVNLHVTRYEQIIDNNKVINKSIVDYLMGAIKLDNLVNIIADEFVSYAKEYGDINEYFRGNEYDVVCNDSQIFNSNFYDMIFDLFEPNYNDI